jgi:transketolase
VKSYGNDVAIFACGFIMDRAIAALEELHASGINGTLVDVSTIKPLDSEGVAAVLTRCGCAVTVEDHNIYGGLGDAVSEVACRLAPCRVLRVGLHDKYPRSGKAAELLDAYGLSVKDIAAAAQQAMK